MGSGKASYVARWIDFERLQRYLSFKWLLTWQKKMLPDDGESIDGFEWE